MAADEVSKSNGFINKLVSKDSIIILLLGVLVWIGQLQYSSTSDTNAKIIQLDKEQAIHQVESGIMAGDINHNTDDLSEIKPIVLNNKRRLDDNDIK